MTSHGILLILCIFKICALSSNIKKLSVDLKVHFPTISTACHERKVECINFDKLPWKIERRFQTSHGIILQIVREKRLWFSRYYII